MLFRCERKRTCTSLVENHTRYARRLREKQCLLQPLVAWLEQAHICPQPQQHRELRDSLCINLVLKAQSLHTPILVLLVHESSRIWRITSRCAETGVQHPGLSESERRDQQPSLGSNTGAKHPLLHKQDLPQ